MTEQLSMWSTGGDVALTALTWPAVAPGSSDDQRFRVKNLSSTYTAYDITVSLTGTGADQHWLSTDGSIFTATVNIANLAPAAVSRPLTLRRVTPAAAATGDYSCNVHLQPVFWK